MNQYFKKSIVYSSFLMVLLTGVFTRSFLGLSILGFRLGEIIVGVSFLISIYFLVYGKLKKYFDFKNNKFKYTHKLIILYSLTRILLNFENISLYNFKSSSYVWTISLIYVGFFISTLSKNDIFIKLAIFLFPLTVYIFQTGNFPNLIISFFQKYSDKFQFMKASDMVIVVIMSSIFVSQYADNKKIAIYWSNFLISIFLPLVAANSRAAVGGLVLFFVFNLVFQISELKNFRFEFIILLFIVIVSFFLFKFKSKWSNV